MPRIRLKPNSPEYADEGPRRPRLKSQSCDMPGCAALGECRAPKDRSLKDYYHFCAAHAQEYNAAWNYFAGMSDHDVEAHILRALYGDRPTWRSDSYRGFEAELQRKIRQMWSFSEAEEEPQANPNARATGNPELDALAILGLTAPVTFDVIKTRYRALVKKLHPDHHHNITRDDEDLIKRINMAYTILKLAYRGDSSPIMGE